MFSFLLTTSLLVVPILASPIFQTDCQIQGARLSLPSNQNAIVAPTYAPQFIGLGVGVQNYTCNTTSSTYASVGAVAELIDISCLYDTDEFDTIAINIFKAWSNAPSSVTTQEVIAVLGNASIVLGQHYYVPGSPLLPKWDFTSDAEQGNPDAFVVAAATGSIPSPDGKHDVTWVQLKNVQGRLADSVYRVKTAGGVPPTSCTAGDSPLSVKYTAQYWLFGGSTHPHSVKYST